MSDSTAYVLAYPDATLPSSRVIEAGTGLSIVIGGDTVTINPGERLDTLAAMSSNGFIAYTASDKTYRARNFVNGQGITIGNVTAQGNVTISQLPASTLQKIQVNNEAGDETATSSVIRFVAGTGDLNIAISTDGGTGDGIVTIGSTNPLGTVTSVGLSSSNAFITVSGSPVTGSGTLAMTIGTLSIAKGGTAGTTRAGAFNNISPITNAGDMIVGSAPDTAVRLPAGSANQVLQISSMTGLPHWSTGPGTGSVTTIGITSTTGLIATNTPVTTSGIISVDLPGSGGGSAVISGDLMLGNNLNSYIALPIGSSGDVLTSDGITASWAAPATSGTVTSVGLSSSDAFIAVSGTPVTSSGTLAMTIGTLGIAKGGTGQTDASSAFNALSPTTTMGDLIIGTGVNTASRLAIGAAGRILTSNGSTPSWDVPATSGTVTSVDLSSSNGFITISGNPVTTSGTLAMTINTLSIAKGGTGQTSSAAAFSALTPAITTGDMIYSSFGITNSALAIGAANTILASSGGIPAWVGGTASSGNVLTYNGSNVVWAAPATSGTVTSVGLSSSNGFITVSGSPVTTSGTLAMTIGTLSIGSGGTGQTSKAAAFDALSPIAAAGDLILGLGVNTTTRLAIGASGRILTSNGTTATWAVPATSGTVTSVGLSSSDAFISVAGTPVTSSGTLAMTINTLGISKGGTGQTSASLAFNALSPTTSTGDMIYNVGALNTRLPIGSSRNSLVVSGSQPVWGWPYVLNTSIGTATAITTTRTVSTSAVSASSVISLSISAMAGSPTISPSCYVGTIVNGVSFQIVPIAVTGGGGKASSIDVVWKIDLS
jgi:hypothetical protein